MAATLQLVIVIAIAIAIAIEQRSDHAPGSEDRGARCERGIDDDHDDDDDDDSHGIS